LSLLAFSRVKGLCYGTLRRWSVGLAQPSSPALGNFVELLPVSADDPPRHMNAAGCGVRVLLANGIRIELASDFDESTLSRAALALGGMA
jgi:hypothetical protein